MPRAPISVTTRLTAPPFIGGKAAAFRGSLLRWYDQHRRNLPWRHTDDPYRIWLSEIMLQQTRVTAVLDHYRVFLERFPTVETLAAAPLDSVLAAWSGLGYYRRARMLHQCAQKIVEEYRGKFPRTAEVLRTLPGIGRYTAAAIASIGFGEAVAVVDGNVERVVERLAGRELGQAEIWQQAQALLHSSRPGDFNQAMMELGATVCLPRGPQCAMCPVRRWCATQASAARNRVPEKRRKRSSEQRSSSGNGRPVKKEIWCTLDQRNGQVRLVRRSAASSLMPGMWELPQEYRKPRSASDSASWRVFRHSITVTDYTVHVLRRPSAAKGRWIAIADIRALPITGLTRKILRADGII